MSVTWGTKWEERTQHGQKRHKSQQAKGILHQCDDPTSSNRTSELFPFKLSWTENPQTPGLPSSIFFINQCIIHYSPVVSTASPVYMNLQIFGNMSPRRIPTVQGRINRSIFLVCTGISIGTGASQSMRAYLMVWNQLIITNQMNPLWCSSQKFETAWKATHKYITHIAHESLNHLNNSKHIYMKTFQKQITNTTQYNIVLEHISSC